MATKNKCRSLAFLSPPRIGSRLNGEPLSFRARCGAPCVRRFFVQRERKPSYAFPFCDSVIDSRSVRSSPKTYFVYILAGKSGVLYTGITSHLLRRVSDHRQRKMLGFTQRYGVTKLVWFETHGAPTSAIAREKEIKSWRRSKKVALVEEENPSWRDLFPSLT
jgi:putative endonuclease